MKAMKGLSVNRMLGGMKLRSNSPRGASEGAGLTQDDTPEATAARSVRLFCESEGQNNSGDEVLYLPPIVEAAESSPAAAKECASLIRGYLSKSNISRPQVQYNATMLVRILSDNPGQTFTRNIDKKFVETVKKLLKYGRDSSVAQILIETLQNFAVEKQYDENLHSLIEMWKKEETKMAKAYSSNGVPPAQQISAPPSDTRNDNYFARSHQTNRHLPSPQELSSRIEEARTSAKLLTQVVQSTPPTEFLQNDLIREFSDRCQSASRSIQGYIKSQNPAPDNDTMLTLIETSEQLAMAMSKHQRAVLQTRKMLGYGSSVESGIESTNSRDKGAGVVPPSKSHSLVRKPTESGSSRPDSGEYPGARGSSNILSLEDTKDPFRDPIVESTTSIFQRDSIASADKYIPGGEPYYPAFDSSQPYSPVRSIGGEGGQADGQTYGTQREQKSAGPIYRY